MPELKGIKQATAQEYTETSEELRKGYIWFVRHINESGDTVHAEVYLGNRKYGEINDSLEILVSGLTNDVSILSNEVSGLTGDIVEIWDAINSLEFQDLQVNVTYDELYALKHFNLLKPGVTYRITDYECTTSQEDTRSAGHQFDILVKAVATNALSEIAHAAHSSGDTYFQNCKLDAWELKYDIENNTRKYPWAVDLTIIDDLGNKFVHDESMDMTVNITEPYMEDATLYGWHNNDNIYVYTLYSKDEILSGTTDNTFYTIEYTGSYNNYSITPYSNFSGTTTNVGKGVIYYMKDEYNNEAFYDFKNIQYKRYGFVGDLISGESATQIQCLKYDYQFDVEWQEGVNFHTYSGIKEPQKFNYYDKNQNFVFPTLSCFGLTLDDSLYQWFYTFSSILANVDVEGGNTEILDDRTDTTIVQYKSITPSKVFGADVYSGRNDGCVCRNNKITTDAFQSKLPNIVFESLAYNTCLEGVPYFCLILCAPNSNILSNVNYFTNLACFDKVESADESHLRLLYNGSAVNNSFSHTTNFLGRYVINNNCDGLYDFTALNMEDNHCYLNEVPMPYLTLPEKHFYVFNENVIKNSAFSLAVAYSLQFAFYEFTNNNMNDCDLLVFAGVSDFMERDTIPQIHGNAFKGITESYSILPGRCMNNVVKNCVQLNLASNNASSLSNTKFYDCQNFRYLDSNENISISNSSFISCSDCQLNHIDNTIITNSTIQGNFSNSRIDNIYIIGTSNTTIPSYIIESLCNTDASSILHIENLPILPQNSGETQNSKVYIEPSQSGVAGEYYAWTFNTGVLDRYVTHDYGETWVDEAPFPFIPSSGDTPSSWTGLRFTAQEDNSTITYHPSSVSTAEYSNDHGNTWNTFDDETVALNEGDEIYVRGTLNGGQTFNIYSYFEMSGTIAASGNINSLIGVDFESITEISSYCYCFMFSGCTSLTTAPELPATTLAVYCYSGMFKGCTSLTTAPELPTTTLSYGCYDSMFSGCTSLTTAPALPATTLANSCYSEMFAGCTSLTTAPALPATTLANNCYLYMFEGCTSLTTAPELPATTLSDYCYRRMFEGCTSLTTAPALPATTLAYECYKRMFAGCTSLTTAPALPATTLTNYCYEGMFEDCTSLTTTPVLPATTLKVNCYYHMFYECTSLTEITSYAQDISSYQCLVDWLYGVPSTGDFYNYGGATYPSGTSGIPSGWTEHTN